MGFLLSVHRISSFYSVACPSSRIWPIMILQFAQLFYGSQLLSTVEFKEDGKKPILILLNICENHILYCFQCLLFWFVFLFKKKLKYSLFLPYWRIYNTVGCVAQGVETIGIMSLQVLASGNPSRNRWTFQYSSLPLLFFPQGALTISPIPNV